MLHLSIEDPILESFYNNDCNRDSDTFLKKIHRFIEIEKAKNKFQTAFKELELVEQGKMETVPMEQILKMNY